MRSSPPFRTITVKGPYPSLTRTVHGSIRQTALALPLRTTRARVHPSYYITLGSIEVVTPTQHALWDVLHQERRVFGALIVIQMIVESHIVQYCDAAEPEIRAGGSAGDEQNLRKEAFRVVVAISC